MKHKREGKRTWRNFWQRSLTIPTGSKFISEAKIRKHRLDKTGDPVLILTITVDDEVIKYAIHQGLAWQMVREIRKAIGFSESELDAARWIGRYSGGDV
jgi:hypothetical protein